MNTPTSNSSKNANTKQPQENIESIEPVTKALELEIIAPLWKRFMAMLYDSFLVVAISMGYFAILTAAAAFQSNSITEDYSPTVSGIASQLGWVLTLFIFYFYFWRKAGQTVGMKAWRLKIISNTDKQLSLSQSAIRFFGGFTGFIFLGISFWWALIDKSKATLHDKLSDSRMIVTPKINKNKNKKKDKKVTIPDANKR